MKLTHIRIDKAAGYDTLMWRGLDPEINFLLGRNGCGKSTLLQLLGLALNFLSGRRSDDLMLRTYEDATVELGMNDNTTHTVRMQDVRSAFSGRRELVLNLFQVVENRHPKNTVGDTRHEIRQHPSIRYQNALSDLKIMLNSEVPGQREMAEEVFRLCKDVKHAGSDDAWEWIKAELKTRGPKRARPLSCGQFDIAALALDLVKARASMEDPTGSAFVIVDNPETFLHPACQEPALDLIRSAFPQAQMFVASHSITLLSCRAPKTIFWLSRERQDRGTVSIQCVRELDEGSKALFYELYGDLPSAAAVALLAGYERPEYFEFLRACSLPAKAVMRRDPLKDKQIADAVGHIAIRVQPWKILDFGAGAGDLLDAICQAAQPGNAPLYVAVEPQAPDKLMERIERARLGGAIFDESRLEKLEVVRGLRESFDVIVACNTFHEILLPELPALLAIFLTQLLRPDTGGSINIHEQETISVGEKSFIMWTPEDYRIILKDIPGLTVESAPVPRPAGVPLDSTIVRLDPTAALPPNLDALLKERFWLYLPEKKETCLKEIEKILASRRASGMELFLTQRRHAFLVSQVVTICLLERQRSSAGNGHVSVEV